MAAQMSRRCPGEEAAVPEGTHLELASAVDGTGEHAWDPGRRRTSLLARGQSEAQCTRVGGEPDSFQPLALITASGGRWWQQLTLAEPRLCRAPVPRALPASSHVTLTAP